MLLLLLLPQLLSHAHVWSAIIIIYSDSVDGKVFVEEQNKRNKKIYFVCRRTTNGQNWQTCSAFQYIKLVTENSQHYPRLLLQTFYRVASGSNTSWLVVNFVGCELFVHFFSFNGLRNFSKFGPIVWANDYGTAVQEGRIAQTLLPAYCAENGMMMALTLQSTPLFC